MSKKSGKSVKVAADQVIEITTESSVAPPEVQPGTLRPVVAAVAEVAAPVKKALSRDEWKSLSPDERKARRLARREARRSSGMAAVYAKNLTRFATRLAKIYYGVDPQSVLGIDLKDAIDSLSSAHAGFAKLPADWVPARRDSSIPKAARFAEGMSVQIAERRRSAYEGLLDASDMANLTVVKVAGKRLVVETKSGVRLFLPVASVAVAD